MSSLRTAGISPVKAADIHHSNIESVTNLALERSGRSLDEIGGIAVTVGPGVGLCLSEGISFAKRLAKEAKYEHEITEIPKIEKRIDLSSLDP